MNNAAFIMITEKMNLRYYYEDQKFNYNAKPNENKKLYYIMFESLANFWRNQV